MFIFLERDPFSLATWQKAGKVVEGDALFDEMRGKPTTPPHSTVRRPYRGIQIKGNTYASLSVITGDGSRVALTSSSAKMEDIAADGTVGKVDSYSDFILQRIDVQRVEKSQIVETFGDPYIFFFGERPTVVNFSGMLVNTEDFNWRSQFWENYEDTIRGTQLVKRNARVYIAYDTVVLEGYVMSAQASDESSAPYTVPFGMTMLMTNSYDWSSIGDIAFPGSIGAVMGIDDLNKHLSEHRNKYTSVSAEVRMKNLLAQSSLSNIGSFIGSLKNGLNKIGNVIQKAQQVIGGRNVRLPLGVAGYLHATGAAQVAATGGISIGGYNESGYGEWYDEASGQYKTIRGAGGEGGLKMRMPGFAKFAPTWKSKVGGRKGAPLGYIFENTDEYPEEQTPWDTFINPVGKRIQDLLPEEEKIKWLGRIAARKGRLTTYEAELTKWKLIAEGGSLLGSIADGVKFAKDNFGMVMTAAAFINDPTGTVLGAVGIGSGSQPTARLSGRKFTEEQQEALAKKGIKIKQNSGSVLDGFLGKYVGFAAANTFTALAEGRKPEIEQVSAGEAGANDYVTENEKTEERLGEAYQGSSYQSSNVASEGQEGDVNYELAYGDSDYTPLKERTEAEAAAFEAYDTGEGTGFEETEEEVSSIEGGEEVGFNEAELKQTLDEVYGNVDTPPSEDPAALEEVYGTGISSSATSNPEDRAELYAQLLEDLNHANDEDTVGITGVDDDGAEILPVI